MTTTFHDTIHSTRKSRWSTVKKYHSLVKYRVLRWLFCVDDELLDEIKDESTLRDEIREEMVKHTQCLGSAAVTTTMKEIYNATGYDMSNYDDAVVSAVVAANTIPEARADLAKVGLTFPATYPRTKEVRVLPKFAASVTLCLRAKFGNLQATEANRLLIEREYLKVCREGAVRNVDIIAHQQCIMNAYFTEGVLDQHCTVRARAPQWLREAFGQVPKASPTIC